MEIRCPRGSGSSVAQPRCYRRRMICLATLAGLLAHKHERVTCGPRFNHGVVPPPGCSRHMLEGIERRWLALLTLRSGRPVPEHPVTAGPMRGSSAGARSESLACVPTSGAIGTRRECVLAVTRTGFDRREFVR